MAKNKQNKRGREEDEKDREGVQSKAAKPIRLHPVWFTA